ncbi:MAG: outer membrane lipoprotein carrier protein LolA [Bacteroidales bacterium]|nr:outer membrane lipoprotein carrier protein LolA [Bacteroidales bacterium]
MKNLIQSILLFALFMGSSAFGQNSADDLLKKVVDKTRAYKNLKIDFTYTMLNEKAGINETKKGDLYIKGDAYKISLQGQEVISDGKTVWTYLEDSQEVMVSNAGEGDEAMTPSSLLTSYYKDYKATFVNEKDNIAKGLKTIELKPNSGKKFSKMQLGINESKLQLMNLSIYDNGGNVFTYDLSKMVTDQNLAADFFQFNTKKYPGVEVVDMR